MNYRYFNVNICTKNKPKVSIIKYKPKVYKKWLLSSEHDS